MTRFRPNLTNCMQNCFKSGSFGDISYCQRFDFDPFSITKCMILALGLHSEGYGCNNPCCTPPSKFFGVPPTTNPHHHHPGTYTYTGHMTVMLEKGGNFENSIRIPDYQIHLVLDQIPYDLKTINNIHEWHLGVILKESSHLENI